ncbi:MAG: thioredoxin family protein [Planctomycetes bacterium]|nr:thioredoxin family protein [Planctomycetota bacterium]
MKRSSWLTLVGIAGLVAVLAALRGTRDDAVSPGPQAGTTLPAILDFGRGTCVPCRQMMPILDELRDAHAGVVEVRYCDLGDPASAERARELGIKLIPTQVFLAADGSEVFRHEGFFAREAIDAKLAELGWIPRR